MNASTNNTAYRLYLGRSIQPANGLPDRIISRGEIARWVDATATFDRLPGWSMLPATGGWFDDNGKRIDEPTMILELILPASTAAADTVRAIADSYATRFRQSSVMLTAQRLSYVEFRTDLLGSPQADGGAK